MPMASKARASSFQGRLRGRKPETFPVRPSERSQRPTLRNAMQGRGAVICHVAHLVSHSIARMGNKTFEGLGMIAMGCVNCGAKLEITPDIDVFACGYCGSEQRVERKGGIVALRKIESAIEAVQRGTDKTAAELAIPRLKRELAELDARQTECLVEALRRIASQRYQRRALVAITFVGALMCWAYTADEMVNFPGKAGIALALVFGLPLFVFLRIKVGDGQIESINHEFEEQAAPIGKKIDANCAIADG